MSRENTTGRQTDDGIAGIGGFYLGHVRGNVSACAVTMRGNPVPMLLMLITAVRVHVEIRHFAVDADEGQQNEQGGGTGQACSV